MKPNSITDRKNSIRQTATSFLITGGAIFTLLLAASTAFSQTWIPQAPGPNTEGQVENITDLEVVGAIQSVAVHPTNANIVYVGSVNGGIWMTNSAMSANPDWKPQTDSHKTLSIGALEFDPTDATGQTLVAGAGRFSSMSNKGGTRSGLLRTTDGGKTWIAMDGNGALNGLNISGIAARGATIVISVNAADNDSNVGVWRSTNTGDSWRKISGGTGTGLPSGQSSDLAGNPSNPDQLFTNVRTRGLYRSTNGGETWTKVSNAPMDTLLSNADNVKISVGRSNNVYVAIVRSSILAGVFRSPDSGASWKAMELPTTSEGGIHPGGQGGIHLSILADLQNPQIVYIGGDRQPSQLYNGRETGYFPNSLGAHDYSGRLFRGDASKPVSKQWVHLTHSTNQGSQGGGTANNSAPHADSRDMAMAVNGVLIETDDGGIYRRTNPQSNTGDWFSMNGNIQVSEFHSIAWDSNVDLVIGGTQDTGTPEQREKSQFKWKSLSTGDGGVVAVDDTGTPNHSVRYSSSQELRRFRRRVYNDKNVFLSQVSPALKVLNGADPPTKLFYTPIKLNSIKPTRLIIGAGNSVYESLDQGDTITEIGAGIVVNETNANIIAYGAKDNPDVLYVGSDSNIFVRKSAPPATLTQLSTYNGGFVMGIAVDPNASRTAYVIDLSKVFRTTDFGATWTEITGNLQTHGQGGLRTIAYSDANPEGSVIVGCDTGIFAAAGPDFNNWTRLGTGLPNAPVYHMEYDSIDNILLAGTLGRGAWTLSLTPAVPPVNSEATRVEANRRETIKTVIAPAGIQHTGIRSVSQTTPAVRTATTMPISGSQQPGEGAVQLRPGVLIDLSQKRIFIMNPNGGIDAVELTRGELIWSSKSAAKPLGIVNRQLIGQPEPSNNENNLRIVVMDALNGNQKVVGTLGLPVGVKPFIGETLKGEFVVAAQGTGNQAVVAWEFMERPVKGVRPGTTNNLSSSVPAVAPAIKATSTAAAQTNVQSGANRINLTTGAVTPASGLGTNFLRLNQKSLTLFTETLPGISGNQILSSDGRHIMVSERTGDDSVWEKYTVTVFERVGGQRVGQFKSHLSSMTFVVEGSTVIFETESFIRTTGAAAIEEPLKIRAVDLGTGREIWSRQIRDTSYKGPFPP